MRGLILAASLIAGCTTQKTIYLPDGRQGHAIDCSGTAMTWGDCYARAGSICRAKGYDILSKEGEESSSVAGTQYGVFGGTSMKRSLVIACK